MPAHRQANRVKRRVAKGEKTPDQAGQKITHPGGGLGRSA